MAASPGPPLAPLVGMGIRDERPPVLVVTSDPAVADRMVRDVGALHACAVSIDSCEIALEMMEAVAFSLVIVDLTHEDDWSVCGRIARSGRSPVVVLTEFLAADRRYRRMAFDIGVAAYLLKPCSIDGLREMFSRLDRGDEAVEIVTGHASVASRYREEHT